MIAVRRRPDATPVFLFTEWVAEPVFHLGHPNGLDAPRTSEVLDLGDGWERVTKRWLTACGRTISQWGWEQKQDTSVPWQERFRNNREDRSPKTHLRRDHAEAFARLCDRCKAAT